MEKAIQRVPSKNLFISTCMILPVVVCILVLTATAAAQAAPASPPTPAPASKVQFDVANLHPNLKPGVPYAFNFCTGMEVPVKGRLTASKGLKLDTAQGKCGTLSGPATNSMVSGGNPPYHFQLDTMGGFPPIGMHLGMNGLLYGTPTAKPPLGGYQPFSVCAVDLSGNQDCQKVTTEAPPAAQQAKIHHNHKLLVGTLLGVGAVALIGGAAAAGSSGGAVNGECDGMSSVNACGTCSCTYNGTCNVSGAVPACGTGYCAVSGPNGSTGAPFCP